MVTLHLHGSFRADADVAESYTFESETLYDALQGLVSQIKRFKPSITNPYISTRIKGFEDESDLHRPLLDGEEVHIDSCEDAEFSEKSGLTRTLIGVVKVIVGAAVAWFFDVRVGAVIMLSGFADIFSGVAQMLSPQPRKDSAEEAEKVQNRYLGAPTNTVGMGQRIPHGYGKVRCGGHILSMNIDSQTVKSR
jgi:predicted phage tail protein